MSDNDYACFCEWADMLQLNEDEWDVYFEAYFQALKEM